MVLILILDLDFFLCSQEMDSVLIQFSQKFCVHQINLYIVSLYSEQRAKQLAEKALQLLKWCGLGLKACGLYL